MVEISLGTITKVFIDLNGTRLKIRLKITTVTNCIIIIIIIKYKFIQPKRKNKRTHTHRTKIITGEWDERRIWSARHRTCPHQKSIFLANEVVDEKYAIFKLLFFYEHQETLDSRFVRGTIRIGATG